MSLPHDPPARKNRAIPALAALAGLALTGFVADSGSAPEAAPAAVPPATQPAAAEAVSPAADAPDPASLLRQSRERLDGYRTLKAHVSEVVEFGPRRFAAEGTYLQTSDRKVRLDLKLKVGKEPATLLQVCDGDILWTVYNDGPTPQVTRRDVTQILAAAATKNGAAGAALMADLGLGGLGAMIASVERRMEFRPAVATTVGGRRFFVLEGTWNAEFSTYLHNVAGGPDKPLPMHVPDSARLYLDAETYFPYRIRYLKTGKPGEPSQPMLTIDFESIVVNAPIDAAEFRFLPQEGAVVSDITGEYLRELDSVPAAPSPAPPQ